MSPRETNLQWCARAAAKSTTANNLAAINDTAHHVGRERDAPSIFRSAGIATDITFTFGQTPTGIAIVVHRGTAVSKKYDSLTSTLSSKYLFYFYVQ